jgi:uncharacterized phage protein (TIGR01671 family)
MSRKLKFRIWDKQTKVWLENSASFHCFSNWSICPFTGNLVDYVETCDDQGQFSNFSASPAADYYFEKGKLIKEPRYIIQQYTGLKDSKGVEIYEGDIVQYYFNNPDIIWVDLVAWESYGWVLLHFDGTESGATPLVSIPSMEIIGNVLENKELLNQ